MSGFSILWLDLREPADRAARDGVLVRKLLDWLTPLKTPIVVDLGSGTGATLRALNAIEAVNPVWRLVDLDGKLLEEAVRRHGGHHHLEIHQADLAQIDRLPLADANLVTASALFDLTSRDFCSTLVARLGKCTAFYVALNYDGITRWTPTHPLDDAVLEAFNRDQLRDKGFGPALGPAATDYLQEKLVQVGFVLYTASSPWQLDGTQEPLLRELITGIADAVAAHFDKDALDAWRQFRFKHAADCACIIGHQDLLALPP
jgi:SAM-dependent methyltransferase